MFWLLRNVYSYSAEQVHKILTMTFVTKKKVNPLLEPTQEEKDLGVLLKAMTEDPVRISDEEGDKFRRCAKKSGFKKWAAFTDKEISNLNVIYPSIYLMRDIWIPDPSPMLMSEEEIVWSLARQRRRFEVRKSLNEKLKVFLKSR